MPTPLGPKKKRRIRLIVILIILLRFDVMQTLCEMWSFYTDDKVLLTDITAEEAAVTDAVDNLYLLFDPLDDPDNFDACAVSDIKPESFEDVLSSMDSAMATWRES